MSGATTRQVTCARLCDDQANTKHCPRCCRIGPQRSRIHRSVDLRMSVRLVRVTPWVQSINRYLAHSSDDTLTEASQASQLRNSNVRASSTTTIGVRVSRCTLELVLLACGLRGLVRSAPSCSEPCVCWCVLEPRVVVCRVQKPFCLRSWLPLHPPSHS
jgi:hypothetical protein